MQQQDIEMDGLKEKVAMLLKDVFCYPQSAVADNVGDTFNDALSKLEFISINRGAAEDYFLEAKTRMSFADILQKHDPRRLDLYEEAEIGFEICYDMVQDDDPTLFWLSQARAKRAMLIEEGDQQKTLFEYAIKTMSMLLECDPKEMDPEASYWFGRCLSEWTDVYVDNQLKKKENYEQALDHLNMALSGQDDDEYWWSSNPQHFFWYAKTAARYLPFYEGEYEYIALENILTACEAAIDLGLDKDATVYYILGAAEKMYAQLLLSGDVPCMGEEEDDEEYDYYGNDEYHEECNPDEENKNSHYDRLQSSADMFDDEEDCGLMGCKEDGEDEEYEKISYLYNSIDHLRMAIELENHPDSHFELGQSCLILYAEVEEEEEKWNLLCECINHYSTALIMDSPSVRIADIADIYVLMGTHTCLSDHKQDFFRKAMGLYGMSKKRGEDEYIDEKIATAIALFSDKDLA
jgi:hypothetical protein